MIPDDFLSYCGIDDNWSFWDKCFPVGEDFDKEYFIEHADDHYKDFVDYYNRLDEELRELNENKQADEAKWGLSHYGDQYDPDFNWDWDFWFDFFGIE